MDNWLIPCSPDLYDAEAAFHEYGVLTWHQSCNMMPGDFAYIYITSPVQEIRFKCLIEDTDIPVDSGEADDGYVIDEAFCAKTYRRYMRLKLLTTYDSDLLHYSFLKMNGLMAAIRSQRRATPKLVEYIERIGSACWK